ncbi:hypothetical protein B0T26DRAFT_508629 [Lasiosphaeria miniovina]|uniref:Uncharacterized protein n=1 Tax=Lasiosphaeria miniovina TaxID=1954250 RepID=A0AA40DJH2_9PEZI|nr:uncharacterized protein B0T26DRAFT_508629 [Lasiosphaeria miniovina]KAK0703656.1 hypothetical protein B0T26DRAFT_508629 [Lasiosphaeria miniovina]
MLIDHTPAHSCGLLQVLVLLFLCWAVSYLFGIVLRRSCSPLPSPIHYFFVLSRNSPAPPDDSGPMAVPLRPQILLPIPHSADISFLSLLFPTAGAVGERIPAPVLGIGSTPLVTTSQFRTNSLHPVCLSFTLSRADRVRGNTAHRRLRFANFELLNLLIFPAILVTSR